MGSYDRFIRYSMCSRDFILFISERSERYIYNISVYSLRPPSSSFLFFPFHVFERFHSIHECFYGLCFYGLCFYGIIILVFESFSQHIDTDIVYDERAQRAIHL